MPRPRQYDNDLRRRLLDAGSRAISTSGAQHLSLRTLAAEAGTSTAAIYALFGGRGELLHAIVAEGHDRFAGYLGAAPRTADPAGDLLALGLAYRTSALADPHFYRIMFGGAPGQDLPVQPPEQRGKPQQTFAVLTDAVARLVPAERAPEIAYRLWALVHGLVSLELAGLLPGGTDERAQNYQRTLRAAGPALVRA